MGSYVDCLNKKAVWDALKAAGWKASDTEKLTLAAKELNGGEEPDGASYIAAVEDMITNNTSERTRFIERVMGEQAPEVKAAEPAAAPKAEAPEPAPAPRAEPVKEAAPEPKAEAEPSGVNVRNQEKYDGFAPWVRTAMEKAEAKGEPAILITGMARDYTIYYKGDRASFDGDGSQEGRILGEKSGSDVLSTALRGRGENDIIAMTSAAAKEFEARQAELEAQSKADAAEQARRAEADRIDQENRATLEAQLQGEKFKKGEFVAKGYEGKNLKTYPAWLHKHVAVYKDNTGKYVIGHPATGAAIGSGFGSLAAAKLAAVRISKAADLSKLKSRDDVTKPEFKTLVEVVRSVRSGDPLNKPISSGGTLYGGFPLDVEGLKKLGATLFGSAEDWGKVGAEWKNMVDAFRREKRSNPEGSAVARALRAVADTSSGAVRGILRNYNSKTAQWVVDQFSTEAGSSRVTGKTYEMAVDQFLNKHILRLDKALGKMTHDMNAMQQVANLVRNPAQIKRGTPIHDAAAEIRGVLDDTLKYLREAGVDVGEVKGGYYPREFDVDAILKQPKVFLKAAAQAYTELGMSPKAADEAASKLHDTLLFSGLDSMMKPARGQVQAPFLEGRVFGKQVDQQNHPLNKFLLSDPSLTIGSYLTRAARRAEIARRFGDGFTRWNNEWKDAKGVTHKSMVDKMVDEGAISAVQAVEDYVALAAGINRPGISHGVTRGAQAIRFWTTLAMLEKATLSSLSETFTPGIRSGNVMDSFRSLRHTVAALVGTKDGNLRRQFAEDAMLMGDTMSPSVNAARYAGGEPVSHAMSKDLDTYFRRTGLQQWTNATRVASVAIGQVFMRRLAKQMQGSGGALPTRHLAELGIPREQQAAFSKWLLSLNDGQPTAGQMTGNFGEMYRDALHRFLRQSIMHVDRTTRPGWASHPVGAVAFQLQSFNYAFFENVWKRDMRLAMDAARGTDAETGQAFTALERAKLMAPLALMPMLMGAAFGVGELRDEYLGDPERRAKETAADKLRKAASRGAPIAPIEPMLNLLWGSRFPGASVNVAAGPALGSVGRALDATGNYLRGEASDTKSNAHKRQAAKAFYDLAIEPGANFLLNRLPGGVVAAGATQFVGSGTVREKAFVEPLAGPKPKRGGKSGSSIPAPRY